MRDSNLKKKGAGYGDFLGVERGSSLSFFSLLRLVKGANMEKSGDEAV